MLAEIVSIGDELSSGERLDTNSQWLAQQLALLGIRAMYHTTVADDLDANIAVFRTAASRVDFVIATGGLGPTADDLTREAVAQAFHAPLYRDAEALESIRNLFRKRGREMPERNAVQADFPRDASIIPNPHGSAPGFWLTIPRSGTSGAHVAALPGVPAEMKQMWEQTVVGRLQELLGERRQLIQHKTLHCFGAGESDVEAMLPDLIRRGREPLVGITASRATITLRITARGSCKEECDEKIAPVADSIRQCLGSLVFGEDGQTLEQVAIDRLRNQGQSIAVFDAVTGGRILQWLRDSDPLGLTFVGGTLVSLATAREASVDDANSTLSLATECRERFGTTWGLALRMIETADGEALTEFVEIALDDGQTRLLERQRFSAHPDILLPRAAKQGLDLVRRTLTLRPSS